MVMPRSDTLVLMVPPDADTPDPVVKRIEEVLELRGWTPYELSKRSGLASDSHVGAILKRGTSRTARATLRKIAAGAGVHERWLLDGEGPRDLQDEAGLAASAPVGVSTGKMRDRANFYGCLAAAQAQRPQYRDYLWQAIEDGDPILTVPLTPALIVDLADMLVKYLPAPAQERAAG